MEHSTKTEKEMYKKLVSDPSITNEPTEDEQREYKDKVYELSKKRRDNKLADGYFQNYGSAMRKW